MTHMYFRAEGRISFSHLGRTSLFHYLIVRLSCIPALHNILHTSVAWYSLFLLKVPLNTNLSTNQPIFSIILDCVSSRNRPKLFIIFLTVPASLPLMTLLSCSINIHRHTPLNWTGIILTFNMSIPSSSTFLDHQTDWSWSQQFSDLGISSPSFRFKTSHPYEHTCFGSVFHASFSLANVSLPCVKHLIQMGYTVPCNFNTNFFPVSMGKYFSVQLWFLPSPLNEWRR